MALGQVFSDTLISPDSSHSASCSIFINHPINHAIQSWHSQCHYTTNITKIGFFTIFNPPHPRVNKFSEYEYMTSCRLTGDYQSFGGFLTPRLTPQVTQLPIYWIPCALSLRVKWLRCKADHSPPSSADVKDMWNYTSTSPCPHGLRLN
jgi:hypothetical protein